LRFSRLLGVKIKVSVLSAGSSESSLNREAGMAA